MFLNTYNTLEGIKMMEILWREAKHYLFSKFSFFFHFSHHKYIYIYVEAMYVGAYLSLQLRYFKSNSFYYEFFSKIWKHINHVAFTPKGMRSNKGYMQLRILSLSTGNQTLHDVLLVSRIGLVTNYEISNPNIHVVIILQKINMLMQFRKCVKTRTCTVWL